VIKSCMSHNCSIKGDCDMYMRHGVNGVRVQWMFPHPSGEACEFFKRNAPIANLRTGLGGDPMGFVGD